MRHKYYFEGPPATGKTFLTNLFNETSTFRFHGISDYDKIVYRILDIEEATKAHIIKKDDVVIIIDDLQESEPELQKFIEGHLMNLKFKGLVIISQEPPTKFYLENQFSICSFSSPSGFS